MNEITVSAVIITLNEEARIERAIRSVLSWVDEIVLVDMQSDDRTVEIAQSLGARCFQHPRVGFVEPARANAVSYARGGWLLILDADEMVSYPLAQELRRIAALDLADVCRLPRLNYILGKPMLHGQHAPDHDPQVRFFKKGTLQFSDRIHSFPLPGKDARVQTVKFAGDRALFHFHAATASDLIEKMNRYTTTEAEQVNGQGKRAGVWRMLLLPPLFFLRGYVFYQGWRDGWRGFYWACLISFYLLTREAKHLQLSACNPTCFGIAPYAEEAALLLRAHDDTLDLHPYGHQSNGSSSSFEPQSLDHVTAWPSK